MQVMAARTNFADPSYEPSDEDLAELMHEAFSGIPAEREASLEAMRARIAAAQDLARARLAELLGPDARRS